MAIIQPFQGYLPSSEMANKISSPPYDILSSDEARKIVFKNHYSFLRVIKPQTDFPAETNMGCDTIHKHGAKNLQDFINEGRLQQDNNRCFYIYKISMGHHSQTGVVAAVSISEYNKGYIKKHELTRSGKEDDRTRHIEVINANTGPVFLICRNNGMFQSTIEVCIKKDPIISFIAENGTTHNLWKIDSSNHLSQIADYFKTIPALYIADGHHRAAAASRVQKIREDSNFQHKGDESYNYFLSVIFPHDEIKIMGYNRLVKDLNGLTEEQFLKSVESNFSIIPLLDPQPPNSSNNYSMFLNDKWYNLKTNNSLKSKDPIEGLDVSILQNHLLNPILGIENPRTNNRIDFVGGIKGLNELERRCKLDAKVAFALHAVSTEELLAVADADQVMPPKSTWFEPKLRSGLVVRVLD